MQLVEMMLQVADKVRTHEQSLSYYAIIKEPLNLNRAFILLVY